LQLKSIFYTPEILLKILAFDFTTICLRSFKEMVNRVCLFINILIRVFMKQLLYISIVLLTVISFAPNIHAKDNSDDILLFLPAILSSAPPAPKPKRTVPPIVRGKSITTVLTTPQSGFFSLEEYQNRIYAGTYCFPAVAAMLHNTTGLVYGINTVEESIYDLYHDPVTRRLYISSEKSSGRVYTWDGKNLVEFWDGPLVSTIATRRVFGHLVTISADYENSDCGVYVHGVGRPHLPNSSGKFIRDIVVFKGKALIIGFDYNREVGGWYESTDLIHWTWRDMWPKMRFLRAKVAERGKKLYIGGSPYTNGARHGPGVLLQTYSLNSVDIAEMFPGEMVFGFDVDQNSGAVYVGAHMGWRDNGKAQIWRYYGGHWTKIAELAEAETPALLLNLDGLYVATRQQGGHGKVYLIK
jgi:hypothetical protein